MAEPLHLLIVDDAPEHARMVEAIIRSGEAWPDARIRIAVTYDQAIEALAEPFDVAFFDVPVFVFVIPSVLCWIFPVQSVTVYPTE